MRRTTLTLLVLIGMSCASVAGANYDEVVDGDLSGDRLAPTVIAVGLGSNTISATSVSGDREYFTVTIPVGAQLSELFLSTYVSVDPLAFIGVQNGATFTQPPTGTDVTALLGWTHFGTGNATDGTDILDDTGAGAGAIGFTPPLPAGQYTFWSQQTGANPATYVFDLRLEAAPVAPATSGLALLVLLVGLGLAATLTLRLR